MGSYHLILGAYLLHVRLIDLAGQLLDQSHCTQVERELNVNVPYQGLVR